MIEGSAVRDRLDWLRRSLPKGRSLPDEVWRARHRGIVALLWLHAAVIPAYALLQGFSIAHTVLETAVVPLTAVVAMWAGLNRRVRTAAASLGLLSCSAVLVHLADGLIEMHFHFFVMVAVVALYQDWVPFFAAIGYVFVHHGLFGALDPGSVFNHPAALNGPWKWAGIHAFFITGISVACLVTWRLNEQVLDERRRVEELLLEESRIVRSLHEVGQKLAADLDTQRVVQAVTDAATELTGAGLGAFFYNVVDASGESYMLYTLSGAPVKAFAGFGLPRNTKVFAPTFNGEAVVRLDDVTTDSRYGQMSPHFGMPRGHPPVRSYLAVPVRSRTGEVLGGLFFGHPEPGRFGRPDQEIVVGIAAQAAIALDNARLYESELEARSASESAQATLALLAEASKILNSSLELDTVLAGLTRLVASSTGGYCLIDLIGEDGLIHRLATDPGSELPATISPAPVDTSDDAHPVVRAIRSGHPLLFDPVPEGLVRADPVADGALANAGPVTAAPTTAIIAPMIGRRNQVLGALSLVSAAGGTRQFGEREIPFAEELARRASSAIENTRLYSRQRTVAETLQHSLLPERLLRVPGLAATARYVAGGPDVEVGGDWYDLFQLPDGRLALVLGDVVGRGERAAALMGKLRNAVRAYAVDGKRPQQIAESLNALLMFGGDDMATMIYGVLDTETGEFCFVNAGHPPPMVAYREGDASFLEEPHGLPLGAWESAGYLETSVVLAPGDTLLLYTDGLVETRSEPLGDGLRRLREIVLGTAGDLEQRSADILGRVLDGRTPDDDIALLAVQVVPLGERLVLRLPAQSAVLAPLRATLRRWLNDAGATQQERDELLVAAGEACTNAIRHASGPAGSDFEFEAILGDDIMISVRDEGRWREPRKGDGGYGLAIIEAFVDHLDVLRTAGGTEVRMRRKLAATSSNCTPS